VVEHLSAPTVPSLEMERKTPTTIRLSGMPKRFMIAPRCSSGSSRARSVPIVGK
jgi:hypothetical protein